MSPAQTKAQLVKAHQAKFKSQHSELHVTSTAENFTIGNTTLYHYL